MPDRTQERHEYERGAQAPDWRATVCVVAVALVVLALVLLI